MKYYRFEQNDSDGNDNFITDLIVNADSQDAAFAIIAASIKEPFEDSGLGDENSAVYECLEHAEDCASYEDGEACDCEPTVYSKSFYYQAEYETLEAAKAECAYYHAGPVYLGPAIA